MKINSNIILAILGFFAIRWYLGNRNKLDNNFQPQIVVDPTLSTTTDWHDGLIMITNNNGGNFYVDIALFYKGGQDTARDYFTISGLPLPASNTYININNGFLADGSNYSAMLLDGSYYDLSTFQEVYRGCLDINDPNYLSTNLYQIPSIDCANYNGDNSYYNI